MTRILRYIDSVSRESGCPIWFVLLFLPSILLVLVVWKLAGGERTTP